MRALVAGRRLHVQSETFDKVCKAIAAGDVHVSEHAYDEAVEDEPVRRGT